MEHEELSVSYARKWGGMRGQALPVLLDRLNAETDPLGKGNTCIIASGLLNGLVFPGVSRYGIYAKSPLTGGYGESEAGGYFGPGLKGQGVESIVLTGVSEKPVYLFIQDGDIRIIEAEGIWGKETGEALDVLKEKHGKITAILIGPAGENLVRYACVTNDLHHANGRSGMGAVLGSKKVKAVVCPYPKPMRPASKDLLKELMLINEGWKENPLSKSLNEYGTIIAIEGLNEAGILPTRNFQEGVFDDASQVGGIKLNQTILKEKFGCFACAIKCKRKVEGGKLNVNPMFGGPEYETACAFGPLCGVSDLDYVAKAHELCNRLGLDTISTGSSIAWLMECVEKEIISPTEAGVKGFGDAEGMLKKIEEIAFRKGIGQILAEGIKIASEETGKRSDEFAMHVKGQELPMHDPRGKFGIALAYACSPNGADHMQFAHDPLFAKKGTYSFEMVKSLGISEPSEVLSLDNEKIVSIAYLWILYSLMNHLGMCFFAFAPRGFFPIHEIPRVVECALGWNASLWELMKMGERGLTAARLLNNKLGFNDSDDNIPNRLFESLKKGPRKGTSIPVTEFNAAKKFLYKLLGWDEKGSPRITKIVELGIMPEN